MKSSYSDFMQSKYFDSMFNAAIFDGSFRIYFHQSFESLALKIYFLMNQKLDAQIAHLRDHSKKTDTHAFILFYPSTDKLKSVFNLGAADESISCCETWDEDLVFGVSAQMNDEDLEKFILEAKAKILNWLPEKSVSAPIENQL